MKKSWDYTQLNTGILHIHDDHLKFYSNSWGHNFVEIEINFMKWILIQVYFFVGSGMLTLYKVQKLSLIIKKGKGYIQSMKKCNCLMMPFTCTCIYKQGENQGTITAHTETGSSHLYSSYMMSFLFKQLSISFYHSSVNQM